MSSDSEESWSSALDNELGGLEECQTTVHKDESESGYAREDNLGASEEDVISSEKGLDDGTDEYGSSENGDINGEEDEDGDSEFDLDAMMEQDMIEMERLAEELSKRQVKRPRAVAAADEEDEDADTRRRKLNGAGAGPTDFTATTGQRDGTTAYSDEKAKSSCVVARRGRGARRLGLVSRRAPPPSDQCTHPSYVWDLCTVCGAPKPVLDEYAKHFGAAGPPGGGAESASAGGASVVLRHLHAGAELELSEEEAARMQRDNVENLLSQRRLLLILDLDNTLLNSIKSKEALRDNTDAKLREILKRQDEANKGIGQAELYDMRSFWTKLRPGVFEFLRGLKPMYELHVFTMGDSRYAARVRQLLDPTGKIFTSVVSREHASCASAPSSAASGAQPSPPLLKKSLAPLLSAPNVALVLDDCDAVWAGFHRNLVTIEPYHYFAASAEAWGVPSAALMTRGRDEDATAGALAQILRVFKDVHARFFSASRILSLRERDVRADLAHVRARVLDGCRLAFVHCWLPGPGPEPEERPPWLWGEALGAICTRACDSRTTHLVVGKLDGGAEELQARAEGKHVVLLRWLKSCWFNWRRMAEHDFAVPPPDKVAGVSHLEGACGDMSSGEALMNGDSSLGEELTAETALALAAATAGEEEP